MHKNCARFQERAQGWAGLPGKPVGLGGLPKSRQSLRGWGSCRGAGEAWGAGGELPGSRRSLRGPWWGWALGGAGPGGAAFPRATWSKCIPDTSAMLSRCGTPPAWRARLHKRVKDYREMGTKLRASGKSQDCTQRTAATTYHTAGKLWRGQGPSPPPSSSSLSNVAANLRRSYQVQERSISSPTSGVSSAWNSSPTCACLKAMLRIISYVRPRQKALRSRTNRKLAQALWYSRSSL